MRTPTVTVAIVEDNATRAELYGHWLDHVTVRIALTKRQVLDVVDADLSVAIVAEEFGDGAAPKVLDLVRAKTRYAQVITTSRDRSRSMPSLDVDNHLTKPIFEADLRERVERLARQTIYCTLLDEYYRTSAKLTAARKSDDAAVSDRIPDLEEQVAELKPMVTGLRTELDEDDVAAVAALIKEANEIPEESAEGSSKYVPTKCFNCGRKWGVGRGNNPAKGAVRLGSHVWRCTDCGHIQMGASGGNPRLTHSK